MISDAYFPTPYPEELLYSLLARYRRHLGLPKMMYVQDILFGNRHVIAAYDLPGHLSSLRHNLPDRIEFSEDHVIEKMTLFNYLTAFQSATIRDQIRGAMRGSSVGIHTRLGITTSQINRLTQLQFCPICLQEMQDQYGELYWRRDHQLAGAYLCPSHGCLLLKSEVEFARYSRHEYIAATFKNCPSNAHSVIQLVSENSLSKLTDLTQRSVKLLQDPPEAKNAQEWTSYYHNKLIETGFAKSFHTINQKLLHQKFHECTDETLSCLPNGSIVGNSCDSWLNKLVRKQRTTSHPLFHLLLQYFLEQFELKTPPFGFGPWPCLNPIANHNIEKPITKITTHKNHGKLVAVFQCSCGYTYTRNFDSITQDISEPRLLSYGPMLAPKLTSLIADGKSLREISRLLNIDPKTVASLALEFELKAPWHLKPSTLSRKPLSPTTKLKRKSYSTEKAESLSSTRKRKPRLDWARIDDECAMQIINKAEEIMRASPPIRISIAELERRIGKKDWIYRYKDKIPKTMAAVFKYAENFDEFQTRRIQWTIDQQWEQFGEVRIWRVMRQAGIPSVKIEKVASIVNTSKNKH
ncbi:TnsD family Tn7-like transposition protein [Chitinibacter sp. S2-10]|uniref:TnsD family Tn7-like transposition protein n=1 Tax=Chitinibacter sp. S2-10 TaxID=3373597 RepID=UPI003977A966